MYAIEDYDYPLPEHLIAQYPEDRRDESRLLYLRRKTGKISHHRFFDIARFVQADDVLVVNNTEVIPARIFGEKESGGKAEMLLLDFSKKGQYRPAGRSFTCDCLIRASKRPKPGARIFFDGKLTATILGFKDGVHRVCFEAEQDFLKTLYKIGRVPLPPYIRRDESHPPWDDTASYQTVYASQKGAVAAPTAGLHFSEALISRLKAKGIRIVEITLHVGYGTFLPVRVNDIRTHRMHAEWYAVSPQAADAINGVKARGGRAVAVGTTSVRTLEHATDAAGTIHAGSGLCDLFIYPGYAFRMVDGMITNYHLPKSTLLMLVSAFAGRDRIFAAYDTAIREKYRFYSYGDAMLIL